MKKTAPVAINLLPKDPFLSTPVGKLLQWALSVGRYLVIFTELIVIISFGTRFSLDRQVTDLNTAILQKKIIIESYEDLEQQVRDVQSKIDGYRQVEQQQNLADVFPAMSEITPPEIALEELSISPTSVSFSGISRSSTALDLLISNIQLSPAFSDVIVDKIEKAGETSPDFKFQIHAHFQRDKLTSL